MHLLHSLPLVLASSALASAQECEPNFAQEFHEPFIQAVSLDEGVHTTLAYDDGTGAKLYFAGKFNALSNVAAKNIVTWDGTGWSAVGPGVSDEVNALAIFDDGGSSALAVGGRFTNIAGVGLVHGIARWNGTSWAALGAGLAGGQVLALAEVDDGSGPALYAGGTFTSSGGASAQRLARWNGSNWIEVGGGVGSGQVLAIAAFDDGTGPALFVGGSFLSVGGVATRSIARWDGSAWSEPAGGSLDSGFVEDLLVFDDGSGAALYAAGSFSLIGGTVADGIARWDGAGWSALSTGLDGVVKTMHVDTNGDLVAAGRFTGAGGAPAERIARWDGASWSALGLGLTSADSAGEVTSLASFDEGDGSRLFAAGFFERSGDVYLGRLGRWDGTSWTQLASAGGGLGLGSETTWVFDMQEFDDGLGARPGLYVGGRFQAAGDQVAQSLARWDGTSWTTPPGVSGGGPEPQVRAMEAFEQPNAELIVAGKFNAAGGVAASNIASWDGSSWSSLGSGVNLPVNALGVFDDGGGQDLYVGGEFTTAGGIGAQYIARWDGSAWSAVGTLPNPVTAFVEFDDGSGPALFIGMRQPSTGTPVGGIRRWDGTTFTTPGGGLDNYVDALIVFDDGSGPALYAGGSFTVAGGIPAVHIVRWDGSTWSALGGGIAGGGYVRTLAVHDQGDGPELVAGGAIFFGGSSGIASWNGSTWSGFANGLVSPGGPPVGALASYDDGRSLGPALYIGGDFIFAGTGRARGFVRWARECDEASFCAGDGLANACPCGNSGALGHGCDTPQATGGVLLETQAFTPDGAGGGTVDLVGSSFPTTGSPTVIAIRSETFAGNGSGAPFGDGLLCLGAPVVRLRSGTATGGALGFSLSHGAGEGRFYYQLWFRSNPIAFCDPVAAFNLSNGVSLVWP